MVNDKVISTNHVNSEIIFIITQMQNTLARKKYCRYLMYDLWRVIIVLSQFMSVALKEITADYHDNQSFAEDKFMNN